MTLSTRDSADHIYAHGLRNQWHPVVPSRFVEPGGMRRVTALGENWLLFRKSDGALSMLADRCPHRGAPLSLGKHLGDRVACWYHGVEVDGAGTVTSVPGLPGCNLEGKTLVTSLPVREVGGAILAYFGDEEHPEPVELTLPEPLADEEDLRLPLLRRVGRAVAVRHGEPARPDARRLPALRVAHHVRR